MNVRSQTGVWERGMLGVWEREVLWDWEREIGINYSSSGSQTPVWEPEMELLIF